MTSVLLSSLRRANALGVSLFIPSDLINSSCHHSSLRDSEQNRGHEKMSRYDMEDGYHGTGVQGLHGADADWGSRSVLNSEWTQGPYSQGDLTLPSVCCVPHCAHCFNLSTLSAQFLLFFKGSFEELGINE